MEVITERKGDRKGEKKSEVKNEVKKENVKSEGKEEKVKSEGKGKEEKEKINQYDDKVKNGVKTYTWGDAYWTMWHLLAESCNNFSPKFAPFVKFLMLSPQDLLPCVHCRRSLTKFLQQPDYNVDLYLKQHCLPQFVYIVHNAVNRKLSKPQRGGLAGGHSPRPFSPPLVISRKKKKIENKSLFARIISMFEYDHAKLPVEEQTNLIETQSCQCGNPSVYRNDETFYLERKGYLPPYKKSFLERKSSKWCSFQDMEEIKSGKSFLPQCHIKGNETGRHKCVAGKNNPYERIFWIWIETIAFNFPADIQFVDYWNGLIPHKYTFPDGSMQQQELERRLKTYILFFDLLKNFIDRKSALYRKWIQAYVTHTPTPLTFSSRTQLLAWILEMQKACGYCDGSAREDEEDYSFVVMLEDLHPTRAVA